MWIKGSSRLELIGKLIIYSMLYGLIMINWVDLFPQQLPAYHLWLVIMYFAPFGIVVLLRGVEDWELLISLGLLASLMNDLFYYPVGNLLFGFNIDLLEWYKWQLGLYLFDTKWTFKGGLIQFKVSSILMGVSIYLRSIFIVLLCWKWWRDED